MNEEYLAELQEWNRQLTGLLSDPQPGLYTWCSMLGNILKEMGESVGLRYCEDD